jgi:hypothetical protein
MRISRIGLAATFVALAAASVGAQSLHVGRDDRGGGFTFRFGHDDKRGEVEGKRANCEVYARIAQVQADANNRYRCGYTGPRWSRDTEPHFRWCRFAPRRQLAEEQRGREDDLQACFNKLGDFDDNRR